MSQITTAPKASPVLRQATAADLPAMMAIINSAKKLLASDGIPQWQNGRPNEHTITADIDRGWSYVLELDGTIVASGSVWEQADPNYSVIYDGAWLPGSETPYATIHRTCVAPGHHGMHLGSTLLSELIARGKQRGFHQFRIDTHELNTRMQHLITQAGFTYSGIVRMGGNPDDLRRVYQLFI